MTLSTLWVGAEPTNGSLTVTSRELLSHARTLADTVAVVTWGAGGSLMQKVAGAIERQDGERFVEEPCIGCRTGLPT